MSTIFVLALMCYVYFILIWGLITHTVIHEGTSLTMLFGVPALITLALWFLGGPEMLRLVAFYPIRLLAQLGSGLG